MCSGRQRAQFDQLPLTHTDRWPTNGFVPSIMRAHAKHVKLYLSGWPVDMFFSDEHFTTMTTAGSGLPRTWPGNITISANIN